MRYFWYSSHVNIKNKQYMNNIEIKFTFIDSNGFTGMSVIRESRVIPRIGESIFISLTTENSKFLPTIQKYDCVVKNVIYNYGNNAEDSFVEIHVEYSYKIGKIIEDRF